ncbi:MAG: hypothetical protein U9O98_01905 [Asgard group archaeon]|nr:hypothetical protein [Asgard group archaeon]
MEVIEWVVPILMALAITLLHFLGEKISQHLRQLHYELESFGSGLIVGIIFLELLPHLYTGFENLDTYSLGDYIFIPMLIGFTIVALAEKFVYRKLINDLKREIRQQEIDPSNNDENKNNQTQKNENKQIFLSVIDSEELECEYTEQHAIFEGIALIIHSLVIGLLVTLIFDTEWEAAFILIMPFFIRAFTLSFSSEQYLEELDDKQENVIRIISFLAPIIGAAIGLVLLFNIIILYLFYSLALGLIMYIVVRDMLPLGKKGKPFLFLSGILIALGIFLIIHLVIL